MTPIATVFDCEECLALNTRLKGFLGNLPGSAILRKSHYFGGRYENIYLKDDVSPELDRLIEIALEQVAALLKQPATRLTVGYWINLMNKGDITVPHSHDDMDEVLSGTYYIQIPPESGELILNDAGQTQVVQPVEGRWVFFSPRVVHEVSVHGNPTPRISLGMNFGYQPGTGRAGE